MAGAYEEKVVLEEPDRTPTGGPEASAENQDVLAQAFELFNRTSESFEHAYRKLEEKVEVVNRHLEAVNIELENKMAELAAVKDFNESILESMPSGVLVVDVDGMVKSVNQAFVALTGRDKEQVMGMLSDEVVSFGVKGIIAALRQKGGTHIENKRLVRGDGSSVPVSCLVAVLYDKERQPIGGVVIYHDRSWEMELERQLRKKEQLAVLGQLSATVAHEIRNPLGGIEGFASLLQRDLGGQPQLSKLAENIVTGVRHMNKTINQLLEFTRAYDLNYQQFDLLALVRETVMFVLADNNYAQTRIDLDFAGDNWSVYADRDRLRQLLSNTVLNACQAVSKDGGRVQVCLRRMVVRGPGKFFELAIIDNGSGMSDVVRARIFDPFYTTKARGTGLGLAVASKIIELHHGQLDIVSAPDAGTSFRVFIPEGESI